MKEKIKVSLGTVICLIIITILLAVIVGMWYYYNNIGDNTISDESDSNELNTNKNYSNTAEKQTIVDKNETNIDITIQDEIANNVDEQIYSKEQVIELLKEAEQENEQVGLIIKELRIKSIKKTNGEYMITADYYVPQILTQDNYEEMQTEAEITLDNKRYVFYSDEGLGVFGRLDSKANLYGHGYLLLDEKNDYSTGYYIEKIDGGYILIYAPGAGRAFARNKIDKTIKFKIDPNIKVLDSLDLSIDEYVDRELSNILITFQLNADKNDIHIEVDPS